MGTVHELIARLAHHLLDIHRGAHHHGQGLCRVDYRHEGLSGEGAQRRAGQGRAGRGRAGREGARREGRGRDGRGGPRGGTEENGPGYVLGGAGGVHGAGV